MHGLVSDPQPQVDTLRKSVIATVRDQQKALFKRNSTRDEPLQRKIKHKDFGCGIFYFSIYHIFHKDKFENWYCSRKAITRLPSLGIHPQTHLFTERLHLLSNDSLHRTSCSRIIRRVSVKAVGAIVIQSRSHAPVPPFNLRVIPAFFSDQMFLGWVTGLF